MNRIITFLLDILFPPRCVLCDKIVSNSQSRLCTNCSSLPRLSKQPVYENVYFRSVTAAYAYKDDARNAVLRIKFKNRPDLASGLGVLAAEAVNVSADVITWIPLGKRRQTERSYNQAELIARTISKQLNIPALNTMRRKRETISNSSLKGAENRRSNVEDAFEVTNAAAVSKKRVLLVDDVVTTGSTLNECSRELLLSGAHSVDCAVFAAALAGDEDGG